MSFTLTDDEIAVVSEKLDNMALMFTGDTLTDKRKGLWIQTLLTSNIPGMTLRNFAHLCEALDRTMPRWQRQGQMPTVNFILETISTRTD